MSAVWVKVSHTVREISLTLHFLSKFVRVLGINPAFQCTPNRVSNCNCFALYSNQWTASVTAVSPCYCFALLINQWTASVTTTGNNNHWCQYILSDSECARRPGRSHHWCLLNVYGQFTFLIQKYNDKTSREKLNPSDRVINTRSCSTSS